MANEKLASLERRIQQQDKIIKENTRDIKKLQAALDILLAKEKNVAKKVGKVAVPRAESIPQKRQRATLQTHKFVKSLPKFVKEAFRTLVVPVNVIGGENAYNFCAAERSTDSDSPVPSVIPVEKANSVETSAHSDDSDSSMSSVEVTDPIDVTGVGEDIVFQLRNHMTRPASVPVKSSESIIPTLPPKHPVEIKMEPGRLPIGYLSESNLTSIAGRSGRKRSISDMSAGSSQSGSHVFFDKHEATAVVSVLSKLNEKDMSAMRSFGIRYSFISSLHSEISLAPFVSDEVVHFIRTRGWQILVDWMEYESRKLRPNSPFTPDYFQKCIDALQWVNWTQEDMGRIRLDKSLRGIFKTLTDTSRDDCKAFANQLRVPWTKFRALYRGIT